MLPQNLCMNCMESKENNKKCTICGFKPGDQGIINDCLPVGHELSDQYIVGTLLGYNKVINTYIGYDKYFREKVAIKEFFPSEFVSRSSTNLNLIIKNKKFMQTFNDGKDNFLNEARIIKSLENVEGTQCVQGFLNANNTEYLIMDYIEGEILSEYLKRQPLSRLTPAEGFKLLRPVIDILEQIHKKGIIHRDICPENIVVTKEGKAKLVEFDTPLQTGTAYLGNTTSIRKGYSAPEKYTNSDNHGPWTDIYSFAAVAYRTVSGIDPPDPIDRLRGEKIKTAYELGIKVTNENPLFKALELNIENRYHSIMAFVSDLQTPPRIKI